MYLRRPRVAVIGAGLTGVAAAAHVVGHGFECAIFEAGDRNSLDGIWSRVNTTSSLQIHSVMYRFHPSIHWSSDYPHKSRILEEIRALWRRHGLENKTKFECKVTRVYQNSDGKWIVNGTEHGMFDGVIPAVGTCGSPNEPHVPGMGSFRGKIYHSSELDGKEMENKKVAIIGGGASAVEALEFVAGQNTSSISVLVRSEKWIIPRSPIIDALLSLNVFGEETSFSWIPEWLLRVFFYRDLAEISPPPSKGLFTDTPRVNTEVPDLIRSNRALSVVTTFINAQFHALRVRQW